MITEVRFHRAATVLLTAALLATLTVALTGGNRADAVEGPVEVVYVATGQNFPDALAGANLAATVGAPMLTVNTDLPIPDATITALDALDPNQIIILGGPVAVSDAVKGALGDYARSGAVTRIEGGDRHETAAQIADALPDKVHDADKLDGLDSSDLVTVDDADERYVQPADLSDLRSFALPLPGGTTGTPPPSFGPVTTGLNLAENEVQGTAWQTLLPTDREPEAPIEVDLSLGVFGPEGCVVVFDVRERLLDPVGPYAFDPATTTYRLTKDAASFQRVHLLLRHPGTGIGELGDLKVGFTRVGSDGRDTCELVSLLGARVRY